MFKRSLLVLFLGVASVASAADAKFEPAVPVRTVSPEYPDELKQQGIAGIVMITFTVTPQGVVENPTILKSAHPEFSRLALAAIRKWKFRPAQQNGQAVEQKVTVPMQFRIEGES